MAILPFAILFARNSVGAIFDNIFPILLTFAFDILLLALLLHPQTRTYQRIWFR